jgi:hypothetical protein
VADAARSVNQVGEAIRRYLAEIGDEPKRGQDILSAVINLEHAADIIATSAAEFSLRQQKRGKRLSTEEIGIVGAMHAELLRCLRLALAVFLQAEPGDADRLVASKRNFREYEAAAVALSAQLLRSAASQRLGDAESAARVVEEDQCAIFAEFIHILRVSHTLSCTGRGTSSDPPPPLSIWLTELPPLPRFPEGRGLRRIEIAGSAV